MKIFFLRRKNPILFQMNYLETSNLVFSKTFDELRSSPGRTVCPKCNAKRRYYCYDCIEPIDHSPPTPTSKLPLRLHIVRHHSEKPSKSSIIPLKMTYSQDVFLYIFTPAERFKVAEGAPDIGLIEPAFPQDIDWDNAAILYPTKDAKTVEELGDHYGVKSENQSVVRDVVVIDATWFTAEQVIKKTPELRSIPRHIKLGSNNKTIFWRHQAIGRECLATCEAIYVLLREVWDLSDRPYNHEFDDVLFYYLFVHSMVDENYRDVKKHRGRLPQYTLEN